MKKTIKLLQGDFDSASYKTPQFLAYARTIKSELKKEIAKIDGIVTSWNTGHFYISGFFRKDGNCYYFSQSDVRGNHEGTLLVRTAKDEKDFSGGSNHFMTLENDMFINNFNL